MHARQLLRVMVTVGMLVTASHVAFGEERTIQAMAPWQGSGEVFVVAPEKLMILVSFTGIMYLQGQQGAFDGVVMQCPAVQTLDIKAKRAEASGHVPSRPLATTWSTPRGHALGCRGVRRRVHTDRRHRQVRGHDGW